MLVSTIVLCVVLMVASLAVGIGIVIGADGNTPSIVGAIILVLLSIAGCVFLISVEVTPVEETSEEHVDTTYLYALGSTSGIHGTFVRGFGSVNDVKYYTGYTKSGDGYVQVDFNARASLLMLNDTEIPRVETYEKKSFKNVWGLFKMDEVSLRHYVIYIPSDGLENSYKVN